jgi:sugar phosphate isomerase/epimerase
MRIDYAISLWNFYHYSGQPSLERLVQRVRQAGYGIEFWGGWGDEPNLYDAVGRKRLAAMVDGLLVSLHTAGANNRETMTNHIDTAAAVGARTIVLHPGDLAIPQDFKKPNLDHARWAVDYAATKGVRLALENGEFDFLCETIHAVDGLCFCFDVGHPYFGGENAGDFLGALKGRLIHLHLPALRTPLFPHNK